MITYGENIKIFCGNSNRAFAEGICKNLGVELGKAEVKTFADGEASVSLLETVRGADVFPTSATPVRIGRLRAAIPSPPSWWPT